MMVFFNDPLPMPAAELCIGWRRKGYEQILISPRVLLELDNFLEVEELGLVTVKGLARPVRPLNVVRLREPA